MLEQRGWRVRQDASGNTLLIPDKGAAPSGSGGTTPAAGPAGRSMADFRRTAEAAGWRIESTADGSLMMYPPGSSAAPTAATPSPDGGCLGTVAPSVADGSIGLPISDGASARRLAREWLVEQRATGSTVGRLRQINRIYVVSIVDDRPPFQLRNQLIIRADNGHLLPIY